MWVAALEWCQTGPASADLECSCCLLGSAADCLFESIGPRICTHGDCVRDQSRLAPPKVQMIAGRLHAEGRIRGRSKIE